MYALLTALEGGFLLARTQRDVEPLLAAGRAVAAHVAALPVAAGVSWYLSAEKVRWLAYRAHRRGVGRWARYALRSRPGRSLRCSHTS